MARHVASLTGFDNSTEMIKIANETLEESRITNLSFVFATTKQELPFSEGQFDLIYTRRGPTSIIEHSRLLCPGGTIFGIHSGALEVVKARLSNNGYIDVEIEEFNDAIVYFPNEVEFTKFISSTPGNPDYTLPEYRNELELKLKENVINGRLGIREYKYIWKAKKP
jgi:protein-L-isoaspartate O-methyltransferase